MKNTSPWTGERLVPSVLNEISVEHLARYAFCQKFIKQKKVLDAACGDGYGSSLLAKTAANVTGIDIDEKILGYAKEKYSASNLHFQSGNVLKLPFDDASFDVVISFETIEHVDEQFDMMAELKRVIQTDGLLIISTPNKLVYSTELKYTNPFHKKELEKDEFLSLLKEHFSNVQLFHQQNLYGSFLYPEAHPSKIDEMNGDFLGMQITNKLSAPPFFLALASNSDIPVTYSLFFHAQNIYETQVTELKKTWTYRIGNMLLSPLKWIRNLQSR